MEQGQTVIFLSVADQQISGIEVAPLETAVFRKEVRASGRVLDIQKLIDFRNQFLLANRTLIEARNAFHTATAQVDKTQAAANFSRQQLERSRKLYEADRSVSEKTVEAAEAAWISEDAGAQAAQRSFDAAGQSLREVEQILPTLVGAARQQWGDVVTRWAAEGLPGFQRLSHREEVLIQITLPPEVSIPAPPEIVSFQTGKKAIASGKFVSPAPATDPRIQGISYFYTAPQQPEVLPGMNIFATLPVSQVMRGVFLPPSAVVLWQGKSWVYVQKDAEHFIRRAVPMGEPFRNGWFVPRGLAAGERIVTAGAQLLLSEEFRSEIRGET